MSETGTAPERAPIGRLGPRRRTRWLVAAAATAALTAGGAFGLGAVAGTTTIAGSGSAAVVPATSGSGTGGTSSGSSGRYRWGTSTGANTGSATATQEVGIVDVDTVLKYQGAQAAGTGMVLTSSGEVLTNNHVVDGATSITVVVASTGASYPARVVGTDPTADVAVLQLSGASGLQTAAIDTHTAVTAGEAVTGVGNAGGTGGTPSAASGTVTALNQSLVATDETGANAEQLTGMIETDAAVQAGDSGGPLYDAAGRIVGMDTAGSVGGVVQSYAIPISTAVSVAAQIESGVRSATIHQGYPAFLGISVASGYGGGVTVSGVLSGGPAAAVGITAGDVITVVGGTSIASPDDLRTALSAHRPGQTVRVTWADATGASHSASVSLIAGPAD